MSNLERFTPGQLHSRIRCLEVDLHRTMGLIESRRRQPTAKEQRCIDILSEKIADHRKELERRNA